MIASALPVSVGCVPTAPAPAGPLELRRFARREFAATTLEKIETALNALERHLHSAPQWADLTPDTIHALREQLVDDGRSTSHASRLAWSLRTLARRAAQQGLIDSFSRIAQRRRSKRPPAAPLRPGQVRRILAASMSRTERVGQFQGRHWWPAFLLVLLNGQARPAAILQAALEDWDREAGTLRIDGLIIRLHPFTAAALDRLGNEPRERLLPFDRSEWALSCRLRDILSLAGVACSSNAPADPLLRTVAVLGARLFGALDPNEVAAVANRLRARSIARASKAAASVRRTRFPEGRPKLWRPNRTAQPATGTLLHFYREAYEPVKLATAAKSSRDMYEAVLLRLAGHCGREPLVSDLSDELVEQFMAAALQQGRSVYTANRYRTLLLALWRHAFRRRLVQELPRSVERLKEPKRIPRAWSDAEVDAILAAAGKAPGMIRGVPTRLVFPALLLALLDTGLRISALLSCRSDQLDASTGFLRVRAEQQKHDADDLKKLSPQALAAILATRPNTRTMLFPGGQNDASARPKALYKQLKRILKECGMPHGPRDLFHKWRRTSATAVAAVAGLAAARAHLQHSDPNVTSRYVDPSLLPTHHAADLIRRPEFKPADS